MNKRTNNTYKWRFFFIMVLLITFFNFLLSKAQASQYNRWLNWVDYISCHPDYRKHQEPQNIAVKGCCWGTWVTFPNKIAAIAAKVQNWDDPKALFKSLDFVAIYKHPGHYYKHCLAYLSDAKQPEAYKKIVIYAMEQQGYTLARDCYECYQKKQLSEELFRLALGDFELLRIHPLVLQYESYSDFDQRILPQVQSGAHKHILLQEAIISDFDKKKRADFLRQVQHEVGPHTPLGQHAEAILSGQLIRKWDHQGPSPLLHFQDQLPIASTIRQATKEYREHLAYYSGNVPSAIGLTHLSGGKLFMMLLEHINQYVVHDKWSERNDKLFSFLKGPHTTDDEKRLFLFAMHRLDLQTLHLLDNAYAYYCTGNLSLPLLDELLSSSIVPKTRHEVSPKYPRYPFFFASAYVKGGDTYERLKALLDKFIALPTIPCGWKELAKRLKKGTLLSKKELKYLEDYQEFLATHFILYETIPAQK